MKKSISLKITLFFAFIIACLFSFLFYNKSILVHAESNENIAITDYYYQQLSSTSKKFYKSINSLVNEIILQKDYSGNTECDLLESNYITIEQINDYITGSNEILYDFENAKKAYELDHPEIFYIDYSKLSLLLSVKDDEYIAKIGAGRSNSSFLMEGFNEINFESAIRIFNEKIENFILENQPKSTEEIQSFIRKVNEKVVKDFEFSYAVESSSKEPHIETAYGGIVNNKAISEGFAKAFKEIMDRYKISCIVVEGFLYNENGICQPQIFNLVKIDNKWYGIDAARNTLNSNQSEGYLFFGNEMLKQYLLNLDSFVKTQKFTYPLVEEKGLLEVYPSINTDGSETILSCNKILPEETVFTENVKYPVVIHNSNFVFSDAKIGNQNLSQKQCDNIVVTSQKLSNESIEEIVNYVNGLSNDKILAYSTYSMKIGFENQNLYRLKNNYTIFGLPDYDLKTEKESYYKIFKFEIDSNKKLIANSIEEISIATVTDYGVLIDQASSGNFLIVAYEDNREDLYAKTFYLKTLTDGGTAVIFLNDSETNLNIVSVGKTLSIIVKITPHEDYQIDYVLFNKNIVELDKDNTITIHYNQMQENNTFDVAFVLNSVSEKETELQYESIEKKHYQSQSTTENTLLQKDNGMTKGLITGIVIIIIVASIILGILMLALLRRNKKN